jgi:hypothetical protein
MKDFERSGKTSKRSGKKWKEGRKEAKGRKEGRLSFSSLC